MINLNRLFFIIFIVYLGYMLIGHIWELNRQRTAPTAALPDASQNTPEYHTLSSYKRAGLYALQQQKPDAATKYFQAGREMAHQLQWNKEFNYFTIMLGNAYLSASKLETAETLLDEASQQQGIDAIGIMNQRVVLYEKRDEHAKMCDALSTLTQMLSTLDCDTYAKDIKALEQQDEALLHSLWQRPDLETILNCAGKGKVAEKMEAAGCNG